MCICISLYLYFYVFLFVFLWLKHQPGYHRCGGSKIEVSCLGAITTMAGSSQLESLCSSWKSTSSDSALFLQFGQLNTTHLNHFSKWNIWDKTFNKGATPKVLLGQYWKYIRMVRSSHPTTFLVMRLHWLSGEAAIFGPTWYLTLIHPKSVPHCFIRERRVHANLALLSRPGYYKLLKLAFTDQK